MRYFNKAQVVEGEGEVNQVLFLETKKNKNMEEKY